MMSFTGDGQALAEAENELQGKYRHRNTGGDCGNRSYARGEPQ